VSDYPDPRKKWSANYKYKIISTVQVESRKSFIKNLRAMALYMEDEITDEEFHLFASGEGHLPRVDTYRVEGVAEI